MSILNKIKSKFASKRSEIDNLQNYVEYLTKQLAIMCMSGGSFTKPAREEIVNTYIQNFPKDLSTSQNSFLISQNQEIIASSGVKPFDKKYLMDQGTALLKFLNFINQSTNNDLLQNRLYDIDKMIKSNAIIKNLLYIPISDALDGLQIQSDSDRLDQTDIDEINQFISQNYNTVVDVCFKANAYGGSYIMIYGDNSKIEDNIGRFKSYDDVYFKIKDVREMTLDSKEINELEMNINFNDNATTVVNSTKVNKNRIVPFLGSEPAPYWFKSMCRGYSLSSYEGLRDLIASIPYELIAYDEILRKQGTDVIISGERETDNDRTQSERARKVQQAVKEAAVAAATQNGDALFLPYGTQYDRKITNIDYHNIMVGLAERINFYTKIPANKFLSTIGVGGLSGTDVNNNERDYQRVLNSLQRHFRKPIYNLLKKTIKAVTNVDVDFKIVFKPNIEVTEQQRIANQQATAGVLATLDSLSNYKPDNNTIQQVMTDCGFLQQVVQDVDVSGNKEEDDVSNETDINE